MPANRGLPEVEIVSVEELVPAGDKVTLVGFTDAVGAVCVIAAPPQPLGRVARATTVVTVAFSPTVPEKPLRLPSVIVEEPEEP